MKVDKYIVNDELICPGATTSEVWILFIGLD